jgi:uncharacterized membrane protein YdjX (TVP38/TMEM64 family)
MLTLSRRKAEMVRERVSGQLLTIIRLAGVLLVMVVTIIIFLNRDQVKNLEALGIPGVFLISIITNASVFLPVPGVVFTSAMGAIFNPFWVALAAGAGSAIGELSGYLAGYSGRAVIKETDRYRRLTDWMRKYGEITILFLAFVPNPAFDLAGIIAGVLKMPVRRFLFWCLIGKTLKMLLFAYFGSTLVGWLG